MSRLKVSAPMAIFPAPSMSKARNCVSSSYPPNNNGNYFGVKQSYADDMHKLNP